MKKFALIILMIFCCGNLVQAHDSEVAHCHTCTAKSCEHATILSWCTGAVKKTDTKCPCKKKPPKKKKPTVCCIQKEHCVQPLKGHGSQQSEEWITIIVHGLIGFQANVSFETIKNAQRDTIEGTSYERNVLAIRNHHYLFALQPLQQMGLAPIKKKKDECLNASYAFAVLFQDMQKYCGIHEKNHFYTFGWSGLISEKKRFEEACILYKSVKATLEEFKKKKKKAKVRIIGYSHGATLILTLADVRNKIYPMDSFDFDELHLVGLPVTRIAHEQIMCPAFKKIYNIYSREDKVQRLDIFSPCDFLTHRKFIGCLPDGLTQIEMRYKACLRKNPCRTLPTRMRGVINQSPGHIELWFFGWTPTSYRKNLHMYPLPGSVFIPYLVCAAHHIKSKDVSVDIRPEKEIALVQAKQEDKCAVISFMSQASYTEFINKAMKFHPSQPQYKDCFVQLQTTINPESYK